MRRLDDEAWEELADQWDAWRTHDGDPLVAIAAGISSLSEESHYAGWLIHCEWDVLRAVESGEPSPGWGMSAEDIAAFRAHRERASGGWVRWVDTGVYGTTGVWTLTVEELAQHRPGVQP